jgi:hypothetical protein
MTISLPRQTRRAPDRVALKTDPLAWTHLAPAHGRAGGGHGPFFSPASGAAALAPTASVTAASVVAFDTWLKYEAAVGFHHLRMSSASTWGASVLWRSRSTPSTPVT